jgi:VanZ family protein
MDVRRHGLRLAGFGWLSLIFFSSTSVAGEWADWSFHAITRRFFSDLRPSGARYMMWNFAAEKSVHVIAFAILAILLWKIIPDVPWRFVAILSAGLVAACASELLQRLFPGRDPTIRDVIINVAGIALGSLASLTFSSLRASNGEPPAGATPLASACPPSSAKP